MTNLQNYFLIAMPGLEDPFFHRSVTYVCEHNEEGAMGLVVNQPVSMNVSELLKHIEIEVPENKQLEQTNVYAGGPVATDRGFVLHPPQKGWRSSLKLSDDIMITTSKDIMESLGSDQAPKDYLLTLGYAGWEAGQLEQELAENSWLTIPAEADILFATPSAHRWQKAADKLGVNFANLSSESGHA